MTEPDLTPGDEMLAREGLARAAGMVDPEPPSVEAVLHAARRRRHRRFAAVAVTVAIVALGTATAVVARPGSAGGGTAAGAQHSPQTAAEQSETRPGIIDRCLRAHGVGCYSLTVDVPAALFRPARLALESPTCPATQLRTVSTRLLRGRAPVAPGPVRPLLVASLRNGAVVAVGDARSGYAIKTIWFSYPRYMGPVLIRAARIDGKRGAIRLDSGSDSNWQALAGTPSFESPSTGSFRDWPSGIDVTGPGCYRLQVDGSRFSYVLTLKIATSHRP